MGNNIFMSRYLLLLFALLSASLADAQQFLTFTGYNENGSFKAISTHQIDYLYRLYNQRIDNSNEMINGRDYIPYYYRSENKPLLFSEKKKSGSFVMQGKKYENLMLDYDTYLDEVIYYDMTKFFDEKSLSIALNKEQVESFNLYFENDSLTFRNFKSSYGTKFNLQEGFYEEVYNGMSKYIIKHQSSITKEKSQNLYLYSTNGYVMVGESFSKLQSRRGFVKLFAVKSAEIKKYMRSNRIHIRKEDKNKIASVLKYYDTMILSDK
jgi:hypothetical protein